MDLFHTLTELIDLRSFSNLWYWIALAVVWSSASHWVLGVPFDMVYRARKNGEQAAADLDAIVRVNVNRMLFILEVSGHWVLAASCFVLVMLGMLGFVYGFEFPQAVFLLAFPLAIVGLINVISGLRVRRLALAGEDLCRQLTWTRLFVQLVGVVSIFVTALWGMYQNLQIGFIG
ncbi:component of SufBCD complex [Phaeobacter sp.]|uniref:component of SufBCD complex n=1 Tax=Phaeobacter sp. TaxID=1902409 RepID=UPI0025F75CDB|nr:component of SufBCD complex [Phaeobacter sp.]